MNNDNLAKKMMTVINEDGTMEEVEIVIAFKFRDNRREFVVYTKHEEDENGNVTVYISYVDRSGEQPKLYGVDDEEEWNRVKDVLRELSKEE